MEHNLDFVKKEEEEEVKPDAHFVDSVPADHEEDQHDK